MYGNFYKIVYSVKYLVITSLAICRIYKGLCFPTYTMSYLNMLEINILLCSSIVSSLFFGNKIYDFFLN